LILIGIESQIRPINRPSPDAAMEGKTDSMMVSCPALTPEMACGLTAVVMR
jgi:hypothetical protein